MTCFMSIAARSGIYACTRALLSPIDVPSTSNAVMVNCCLYFSHVVVFVAVVVVFYIYFTFVVVAADWTRFVHKMLTIKTGEPSKIISIYTFILSAPNGFLCGLV